MARAIQRRAVAGWVMVPLHVTVDLSGSGTIVKADFFMDYIRPAVDDLGDQLTLELAEQHDGRWECVDPVGGMEPEAVATRPTGDEMKRWLKAIYAKLGDYLEEDGTEDDLGWRVR